MPRRRLRVVCSSDEEDQGLPQQQQEQEIDDVIIDDIDTDFQTVTLNSSNPTPNGYNSTPTTNTTAIRNGNRPPEPIPLNISDDENCATANNSIFENANGGNSYFEVSESPVNGILERLGLRLKREWLDSCLGGLQSSLPGFQGMDDSTNAKLCFEQFLRSDMNQCGAGMLPPNVHALHLVDLKGPFVLQVDEIVNISCPLRGRYQNAAAIKRCLKLSMTDGVQRVFGMEYRPIKDLEVLAPAGLKVAVCNVNIRHGLLMLVPEVLEVLGGTVEELESARQRLVVEINKPPRGKRNRTGVLPPLATRATRAAWPLHNEAVPEHAAQTTRVNTAPLQTSQQGTAVRTPANDMHRQAFTSSVSRNNSELSAGPRLQEHVVPSHADMPASMSVLVAGQGTAFGIPTNDLPRQDLEVPVSTNIAEPYMSSVVQPLEHATIPRHTDEPMTEVMTPLRASGQVATPGIPGNYMPGEDVKFPVHRDNAEQNTSSGKDRDAEDLSMVDEMEHPFMLSRDKESPFTYLASLSAKFAAIEGDDPAVRGKIKCFLTGVKGFLYKQRATYELRVYVDDGSLISEILIDHNVVQNGIGYSPEEVTSALASSDTKRVSEMKDTLKQFQIFLINFEGAMLVEMNKASPLPVAVEMSQGCPASDAWMLLNRLKSFTSAQPQNQSQSHLNPIEISP